MSRNLAMPQFLVCVAACKYPVSLEAGRSYRLVSDAAAAAKGFVRVIDESGEDYLYPQELFAVADPAENGHGVIDSSVGQSC